MPLLAALLALSLPAHAAAPGTYTVSSWDFVVDGGAAGAVFFEIRYPAVSSDYGADADNTDGPFPVVGFMHGYLGSAWMYADAANTLASMGAVVVNLDIETGLTINTTRMAQGMQALLWWVDDNSADPGHWLYGMSDGGDWAVGAHSMGGVALAELVGIEPRVQTVVGYMPYEPDGEQWRPYASFTGTAMMLSGTDDTTATPAMVELWHERLSAADRSLYFNLEGAGHQAISDFEWGEDSMGDAEQRALVLALSSDLLLATREGDDRYYQSLLCDLPSPAAPHRSMSHRPITIADPDGDDRVSLSIGGMPDTEVVVFAGRGPATTETDVGPVDLRDAVELGRVTLDDGIACLAFPLPADLAGIAWVQVAHVLDAGGTTLGEPLDVFGVGDPGPVAEPDPDAEDSTDDDSTDDESAPVVPDEDDDAVDVSESADADADKSSGCATAPGAASALLVGLAALGVRRRRR